LKSADKPLGQAEIFPSSFDGEVRVKAQISGQCPEVWAFLLRGKVYWA
jgi:hypothetical protein